MTNREHAEQLVHKLLRDLEDLKVPFRDMDPYDQRALKIRWVRMTWNAVADAVDDAVDDTFR